MEKQKISESAALIIVSAIPAISYWFAYLYQYSYSLYYDIPTELIEVNLKNIFVCLFAVLAFLYFLLSLADPLHQIKKKVHPVLYRKLKIIVFPILLSAAIGFTFKVSLKTNLIIISIYTTLFVFYELILPVFLFKGDIPYLTKLELAQREDYKHESAFDSFAKNVGFNYFAMIFTLAIGSFFVLFVGAYSAHIKKVHIVTENEDYIILKKYKDNFLLAPLDIESKTYS